MSGLHIRPGEGLVTGCDCGEGLFARIHLFQGILRMEIRLETKRVSFKQAVPGDW
jgi:hypothetical protein